jgi:hypothetical protein
MKHLENYGVQALSTKELKSTDGGCRCPGGFFRGLGRVVGYTAGMLFYAASEAVKIIID